MFQSIRVKVMGAVFVLFVIGIGFQLFRYNFGDGRALVIAPRETAVTVAVDGAAPVEIAPGRYQRFPLKQGVHQLELVEKATGAKVSRSVEINSGKSHKLVSTSDNECFVTFDVTLSHYSIAKDSKPKPPSVETRYRDVARPFELYDAVYLSEDELPETTNGHVSLLQPVPCDALKKSSDAELVAAFGF